MKRIGLDIGATKTLGVLVAEDGHVLDLVRELTEPGAAGVVRTAERVVAQLEVAEVATVGIGVPGLVDVEHGVVMHAVNLGVEGLGLREELVRRLGRPVRIENDVKAAALGVVALSGVQDLVYLSIGTGLAAGVVLDGRLRRGATGAAGEIGHVPFDPQGVRCQCGQRGCLETVASGGALALAWPSAEEPAQALFAAAEQGDVKALAVRQRFAAGLAEAARTLALAVDPRSIVIGGGVAALGAPLVDAVAGALREQARTSSFLESLDLAARVRLAPHDQPVAAVGAALL